MYIVMTDGGTRYDRIKNLAFAPQVDLIGDTLPINEFSADILTGDAIGEGQEAELRDDLGKLWAKYWVVYAERADKNTVRLRARSEVELLDGVELSEVVYAGARLADVLDETLVRQSGAAGIVATLDYALDSALENVTVSGYCPRQTARERLQWVCFASGAYVKTAFVEKITILPIDDTPAFVPSEKTFWRPAVNHGDYVTAVKLTAYAFAEDADAAEDSKSYAFPLPWVATEQAYQLNNPDVPEGIADNPMEIDGLYLLNAGNASGALSRMATRYFKRTTIDLDCINNGEYAPGDRVLAFADESTLYAGYIESASFAFGLQARSTLHLVAVETREAATLTVNYTYGGAVIDSEKHLLPVGYPYSVDTRYPDVTAGAVRTVYRPGVKQVTGTLVSGGATATVACTRALMHEGGVLDVISVDELTMNTESVAVIA